MKPVKFTNEIPVPITNEAFKIVSDKLSLSRPFGIICISSTEEGIGVRAILGLSQELYSEMFFIFHGLDKKEFPPKPVRFYNSIDIPATQEVLDRVGELFALGDVLGIPYETPPHSVDAGLFYEDGYVSFVIEEVCERIYAGKENK